MNRQKFDFRAILILLPLLICVCPALRGEENTSETYLVRMFVSGARQSEIEPCGCVKKQLGGLDCEAGYIADQEKNDGAYLKLDAGLLTKNQLTPQLRLKTEYMLRGLAAMGYQALNVGRDEDQLAGKIFDSVFGNAANNILLCANLYDAKTRKRLYPPHRIINWNDVPPGQAPLRVGVIGLTFGDEFESFTGRQFKTSGIYQTADRDNIASDSLTAAQAVVAELKPQCDLLVLMAEMPDEQLEKIIQQTPGIDLALHTNPNGVGRNAVTARQFEKTWIVESGYLGRYLAKVFAYGTPGAGLSKVTVKSVDILSDGAKQPEITKLIEEYKEAAAKQFAAVQAQNPPPNRLSFVGARACRQCHQEIYESWSNTPHAHALESLVQRDQQGNPECLKCHVVGFQQDNGFRTARSTAYLGGVQCENCHGPGYEHYRFELQELRARQAAKNGRPAPERTPEPAAHPDKGGMHKLVAAATCIGCHADPNDDDFVYDRDVKFIDHLADVADKTFVPHDPSAPLRGMTPDKSVPDQPGAQIMEAPANPADGNPQHPIPY